jgi:hypothetical protein
MSRSLEIIKDFSAEQLVFKKSQDCSSILDHNKAEVNQGGSPHLGWRKKFASVPVDVLDHWITEGVDYRLITKDPSMAKKFYAKLNSNEFRSFRTSTNHL